MYLLDTNVFLSCLFSPQKLGKNASRVIKNEPEIYLSTISLAEISIKWMLGKISLGAPLEQLMEESMIRELPFSSHAAHEIRSFPRLVGHDPFDRMIAASARSEGARLLTSDGSLLKLDLDWVVDSSQ